MPTLSISAEQVCYLIVKAREFDVQDVTTDPDDASNAADDRMIAVLEEHSDNPVVQEIVAFIDALGDDEKADLVALMQLGRGDREMEEWQALHDEALREYIERTADYLLGQPLVSDYLEEGLAQFGFTCSGFEVGRL
ncbi:Protein of unknown function [Enhydrobacter aerosaccus]|uniref:DUF3775 domain-containing protein n=1 Tax=Enhydrobacter aerosaccus TaxID=225324 RepID=A0A1T4S3K5_9HYPH|nr:DUF3775 domain-containing protein [Enhydrobacter aerosaccus]SKA22538.1 Protein of unknown function [Enhydrobacter aerosaccus]